MRAADYLYFDAPFAAFAHRGGAGYPANKDRENTLHAFQQAVELGYQYLETDVHATVDGVLVAFHDTDLLVEMIREHDAYDRVCVSSFSLRRLHQLRALLGNRVPTAASAVGVGINRFLPWITRVFNTPAPVLQIPVDFHIRNRRIAIATERLITTAQRAGKHVHVWTTDPDHKADDKDSMERLIDRGVDGIFTDRIHVLKEVLTERSLWSGANTRARRPASHD